MTHDQLHTMQQNYWHQNNILIAEYAALMSHINAVDQEEVIISDDREIKYRRRLRSEAANCRRLASELPIHDPVRKCLILYADDLDVEYEKAVLNT